MYLIRMKLLRLLVRKSEPLEMLFQPRFYQKQFPYMCLATSACLYSKKKKVNGYEQVDQEKYESLVCSVTSYKASAQTPETIFEEDNLLYGPPLKHTPSNKVETKTPKNWVSLINPEKRVSLVNSDSNRPMKIALQKSKVPSVTRILQQTIPPQQAFYLERWKQKMILELGKDGFAEYTKTLESIFLHEEMATKEQEEDTAVSGYLSSVQHVLKDISEVKALESAVQHETLQYLGLVDCVAKYRGRLCVIDWKTSEKPKPFLQNTFDNPLQVAAYIGAINHDANYDFQVSCGLIVVAYKDGCPAHPHFMDPDLCSQYWNKWLLRLEEYMDRN
ncbi:mitochondrial genome maintenance exonuclease 1 isoform X2 [Gallus gallus]|uniref:mitochondrial genome maintenance exonuclease 1 isoform X2 n=1 Tax=Gallus gallus TaxID=9031 RepID=UPI001EFF7F5F|nr:mitochondrial genome maintenance exonuclease 1 isoform X2 [Gallus gallus]XP_046769328.1 mitochondrial genome maintenance exonuclease 1 isoform X2 [Gallus gallus]XP_046769329.1 mitochondrial genome maintenance exonuclease 1 isoform X2 [Gallus gallus]XP_046769330.1 mitochondrial genome maintenance exonuclease 1 isoform X2 [Gallus gallus]